MASSTMGMIKKTAPCWDSSTVLALADCRTIRVMAMREMAGDTSSRMTSQLMPGNSPLPVRKNSSVSSTSSMAAKEISDTSILTKKQANTLARKISFKVRGA